MIIIKQPRTWGADGHPGGNGRGTAVSIRPPDGGAPETAHRRLTTVPLPLLGCLAALSTLAAACGGSTPSPSPQPTIFVEEGPDASFYRAMEVTGTVSRPRGPVAGGKLEAAVEGFDWPCGVAGVGEDGSFRKRVGQSDPAGENSYSHCTAGSILSILYRQTPGAAWIRAEQTIELRNAPTPPCASISPCPRDRWQRTTACTPSTVPIRSARAHRQAALPQDRHSATPWPHLTLPGGSGSPYPSRR